MDKGFLTKLLRRLIGAPPHSPATEPVKDPIFSAADLRALNEKWREAPLIQLGVFMTCYRDAFEARSKEAHRDSETAMADSRYFTILTRIQSKMLKGALPFAYPRAGTYNYPEKDMFFAEHCYVAVPDMIALAHKLEHEGSHTSAVIFAQALKRAAHEATPESANKLIWKGYEYELGHTAKKNFFLSAYESGSSFSTVLRHHQPDGKNHRPNGPC